MYFYEMNLKIGLVSDMKINQKFYNLKSMFEIQKMSKPLKK